MSDGEDVGVSILMAIATFVFGISVGGCIAQDDHEVRAVEAGVGVFEIVDLDDGTTEFKYACQAECCKNAKREDQ